ncbi:hypothetical protein BH09SUM1_BH09SUM1_25860 [soil metagenome]
MALEKEIETYERLKPTLQAAEGKYVVVQGDQHIGPFETYEVAIQAAYDTYKLTPFLVHKVEMIPSPILITRLLPVTSCR